MIIKLKDVLQQEAYEKPGKWTFPHSKNSLDVAPLDGKTKTAAKNFVHTKVDKLTRGVFSDDFWKPVQEIWKEMQKLGIRFYIQNAFYDEDMITFPDGSRHSVPIRKTWVFKIDFINQNDKPDSLFGRVICAGGGSATEPLDSYDVTLTLS